MTATCHCLAATITITGSRAITHGAGTATAAVLAEPTTVTIASVLIIIFTTWILP